MERSAHGDAVVGHRIPVAFAVRNETHASDGVNTESAVGLATGGGGLTPPALGIHSTLVHISTVSTAVVVALTIEDGTFISGKAGGSAHDGSTLGSAHAGLATHVVPAVAIPHSTECSVTISSRALGDTGVVVVLAVRVSSAVNVESEGAASSGWGNTGRSRRWHHCVVTRSHGGVVFRRRRSHTGGVFSSIGHISWRHGSFIGRFHG